MEKYVHRRSDRHLPPVSLIVFAALLCGFALVNLFWPKRENSELENRKLAQMPSVQRKNFAERQMAG